jgi:phosphohistidine phosphatase
VTVRRLVLIRHAKAAEGAIDRGRPLTTRGHADARAVGEWLAEHAIVPDHVVVSPARRAVETWEEIATALPSAPSPVVDERIYDNTVSRLIKATRDVPDDATTVALVGHNPGIGRYANEVHDGAGDSDAMIELARGYPTAATSVFTVSGSWLELELGDATLERFMRRH